MGVLSPTPDGTHLQLVMSPTTDGTHLQLVMSPTPDITHLQLVMSPTPDYSLTVTHESYHRQYSPTVSHESYPRRYSPTVSRGSVESCSQTVHARCTWLTCCIIGTFSVRVEAACWAREFCSPGGVLWAVVPDGAGFVSIVC